MNLKFSNPKDLLIILPFLTYLGISYRFLVQRAKEKISPDVKVDFKILLFMSLWAMPLLLVLDLYKFIKVIRKKKTIHDTE